MAQPLKHDVNTVLLLVLGELLRIILIYQVTLELIRSGQSYVSGTGSITNCFLSA